MPTTVERVFLIEGRLRSGWRFFLSVPGVLVAFSASEVVADALPRGLGTPLSRFQSFFLPELVLLLGLLGVFKVMTALCDRRPLRSVGLAFHPRWGRELGRGVILGGAMVLTVAGLEWTLRLAEFRVSSLSLAQALSAGMLYFLVLAMAATSEEMVFRGYPFQRLAEAITPVGGVAVCSALFGIVHMGNAHHTWISTAITALVGVPLSIAYLRTRSLWMPVGIHLSWNFVLGFVVGLPVSGLAFQERLLQAQVRGAAWLTGAEYGPEGGVLAAIAIVGGSLYLLLSKRIYVSEEMRQLVMSPLPAKPQPDTTAPLGLAIEQAPDNRDRRN